MQTNGTLLGGGREGNETPEECTIREVKEEFSVTLSASSFLWRKEYPAQKDPAQKAWFMVARINQKDINAISLHEGQEWALFTQDDFFNGQDVIEVLKERFRDYLSTLAH